MNVAKALNIIKQVTEKLPKINIFRTAITNFR